MANRSVPASCRHPVDFSKLVTQTAKAFALDASITCEATDQTVKRTVWFPKSLLDGETLPGWIVQKKIDALLAEFDGTAFAHTHLNVRMHGVASGGQR